jgi:hypothetical protein
VLILTSSILVIHALSPCRRYDPVTHTLLIDSLEKKPPGHPNAPIALRVGEKGRLHAVLNSHDDEVLSRAAQSGVPNAEPTSAQHEHHKKHVSRAENFGRYDPISSSLRFKNIDGTEHTVRVGDNGRLRSVLESGVVSPREAQTLGLPQPEAYKGRKSARTDPGWFNPLTHEYNSQATPRDYSKAEGKRPVFAPSHALTPRMNPLTLKLDPLSSTAAAMQLHDPRRLQAAEFRILPRAPRAASIHPDPSRSTASTSSFTSSSNTFSPRATFSRFGGGLPYLGRVF